MKDTVIVPAQREGFEKAFIGANAWWAIRIAEKHRANLKWIAAYQVLPVAAVTHIAEIDHLEPYGDAGKFKVVFKGPATPLAHPVPYEGSGAECSCDDERAGATSSRKPPSSSTRPGSALSSIAIAFVPAAVSFSA